MDPKLLLASAFLSIFIPSAHAESATPATRAALDAAGFKDDAPVTISPDGTLAMAVSLCGEGLKYSVFADGEALLASSPLGLSTGKDETLPGKDWAITAKHRRKADDVWKPLWGKRGAVPDRYTETVIESVKYGFMNGSPEEKNARTRMITELCAKNRLLCNFHDGPVHPYGQMRTWPNAVTREFCHAQLDAHRVFTPKTFVTTVFVNMLAGPIDMNNGMFDLRQGRTTRVDESQPVPSTLVSEAARTLIVFSGATILPDIPEFYHKYPDLLGFLTAQKQPWRESKTLSGKIGEHIVMARQAADGTWLVGAATDEEARELEFPLSFLGAGIHQATIVQDGDGAHYLTNRETLQSQQKQVSSTDTIKVELAPGGGACVLIRPLRR